MSLGSVLEKAEALGSSPVVIRQAQEQQKGIESTLQQLSDRLITAESDKEKMDEFDNSVAQIEEFAAKVDSRSLSVPSKLPSLNEASSLRKEYQVTENKSYFEYL